MHLRSLLVLASLVSLVSVRTSAAETAGDRMFTEYFRQQTARQGTANFAGIRTLEDWTSQRAKFREQLLEMLGLWPLPERTDLKATVTGQLDHAEFTVEKLHYQALPGLYVTGSLYVPKGLKGKVPAILYVSGHSPQRQNGIAYGAKVGYQHHGPWLARHGYVCLIIDTIELGELEGQHHGTYNKGMWWWNSRGYTPVGVEAWNSMRAIDYLQSRPEVDGAKIGITGRSGGGSYSWYTSAIDERVQVAVPVAGMTDLHNHVVDGCVSGHCDCMYMVNTYRWDYAKVAALIAPRPLLISNTDKDRIFPLDGVVRVHREVANIYALYKATDKLGLLITEGPHKDTQDLQVPALRWFNRYLKGEEPLIEKAAVKLFTAQQLKVFTTLPADQRTTTIHDTFVPMAAPAVPSQAAAWQQQRTEWMQALREKTFRGWPETPEPLQLEKVGEESQGPVSVAKWQFTSQAPFRLPLIVLARGPLADVKRVYLQVEDQRAWADVVFDASRRADVASGEAALVYLAPRGVGPTASGANERDWVHIRRRFMQLGQTIDGMRVWDITRAIEALRQPQLFGPKPIHLSGIRDQAVNALYASLFAEGVAAIELVQPSTSHMKSPDYLNVLRFLDVPQAAAMAADKFPVKLTGANPDDWSWTADAAKRLGWPQDRLQWGAQN